MNGLNLQYEKLWKVRKMGRKWMYFASLTEIMRDLWLYYTILRVVKAFSWWWSTTSKMRREYWSSKKEVCSKLKTGKLKTKKLLKITILEKQEPSVQSADRTKAVQAGSWGNMYLLKSGKWLSQHRYIGKCGFLCLERIPSNNIWK